VRELAGVAPRLPSASCNPQTKGPETGTNFAVDDGNLIGSDEMFLIIGCVLLVLWLLGFVLLKKAVGGLIHIVLIIALVVLAVHFLKGG
jgi:hypothetical protein